MKRNTHKLNGWLVGSRARNDVMESSELRARAKLEPERPSRAACSLARLLVYNVFVGALCMAPDGVLLALGIAGGATKLETLTQASTARRLIASYRA